MQRPAVLETVSLDLYLARELGIIARNFPGVSDRLDAVELLDEFAYRFYQELDYGELLSTPSYLGVFTNF